MAEFRTKKQIEANALDLEAFNLMNRLDRFANDYRDQPTREMAASIDGMRERVRKHMHSKDRAET